MSINRGVEVSVSVIIPVFNGEKHIAEAIDSVLCQDYSPLEILVVDDGSTDNTIEIVEGYGHKVRLIKQSNRGSAAARNNGIQNARGEYIAFLDADDVWWPHKIRYQLESLAQTNCTMAYSRFILWEADEAGVYPACETEFSSETNPKTSTGKIITGYPYPELLLDCIVWTSTVIVKKNELEKAGHFDESLRKGQDYDLWLRLSRSVQMLGLQQPTALYRIHPGNITTKVNDVNYGYLILSRAVERWGEAGPDGRFPQEGLVSERLARLSFEHGLTHLKRGNPKIAANAFRTSLRHSGYRVKTVLFFVVAKLKSFAANA